MYIVKVDITVKDNNTSEPTNKKEVKKCYFQLIYMHMM